MDPLARVAGLIPDGTLCPKCGGFGMHGMGCTADPASAHPDRDTVIPDFDDLGRLLHHATRVETYSECNRLWGFKWLDGISDGGDRFTTVGKRVHSIQEAWLLHGTLPSVNEVMEVVDNKAKSLVQYFPGQIAQAGLHLLPAPWTCSVEASFFFRSRTASYTGHRDFVYILGPDGKTHKPDPVLAHQSGFIPVVGDHKTTTAFKWAKDEDTLRRDIQSTIYTAATMEELGVRRVLNRWIYYLTKGQPKAKVVEIVREAEEVSARMEEINALATEMIEVYRAARPHGPHGLQLIKALDLRPSLDRCEKYNGCPHKNVQCILTTEERMEAIMAKESIVELMARKKAEQARAGTAPPVVAPPPPGTAPPVVPPPPPPAGTAPPPPPPPGYGPAGTPDPRPATPGYWKPGDAMNAAQAHLAKLGHKPSVVASAADVPPPDHIASAYDAGGTTSAGVINPPEAPPVAPSHPGEMPPPPPPKGSETPTLADDLTPMNRDTLKSMAVGLGLADASSRLREDGFRQLIRDHRVKNPGAPHGVAGTQPGPAPMSPAPAPPPPPPAQWDSGLGPHIQAKEAGWILHPTPGYMYRGDLVKPEAEVLAMFTPAPPPPPPVAAPPPPVAAPPPPVAAPPPPVAAPEPSATVEPRPHFILMVNCVPVKTAGWEVYHLAEILEPVLAKMRADTGLPDYRMEEYGKGPGRLAGYLSEYLRDLADTVPAGTVLLMDAQTAEGFTLLHILERWSRDVVRAVR